MNKSPIPGERHIRNAYAAIAILITASIPTIILFGYFGIVNTQSQLLVIAGLLLIVSLVDFSLISLIRSGRSNLAMMILMFNFIIVVLVTTLFLQGLGLIIAIATLLVIVSITSLALPPRYTTAGAIAAVLTALGLFFLDATYLENRLAVPQIEFYAPYIVALLGLGFIALLAREFNRFNLRVKIAMGTLLTGAVTVSVLVAFGVIRTTEITAYLLNEYKVSNRNNVTEQIRNETKNAADQTNDLFDILVDDINIITGYRANLEEQKGTLGQGAYWNASIQLTQFPGGQYGNPATDPASIFLPSTVGVNEAILTDLNTTAYFDFYALDYLENHPEVAAVYFISKTGATTYYPNIDLARNLPPDFEPRIQPFYTISNPANNSKHEPKWVGAYQNPAGQGLIVTLSSPVYANNNFLGVIGIDIQLQQFFERIEKIKIGTTGYAFLVDEAGHILAMPPQGYALFGLRAEDVPANEEPEQSIIGKGSLELQKAITAMMSTEGGLANIPFHDGEELFIAFAPLTTPNYRLGIVAPEKEFNTDFVTSENEAQNKINDILRQIVIILILLFIGAVIISLIVGQVITRPLIRLTQIVETISTGNLAARANVNAEDETGVLARAFNTMAERLSEDLATLEERVAERTDKLQAAHEIEARRAAQFESIARVARAISSTQTTSELLPQITTTISEHFGFYHVGIFLLDAHREYAILVAANSEGGQRMLDRNHRLRVGGSGIVGFVTNIGQPRVALDVGQDAAFFNNPDLPETHSELALPLHIGTEVIGALDVQSREINAFSQEDVSILSTLADQVSIAIQNARSYQQSREALARAEAASIQMGGQQWKQFFATRPIEGYIFDGIDTKNLTSSDNQRSYSLSIPLTLRGTHIGTLKLNALDPSRTWTDDEIAMVQAIAERTALAVESARLLQEAQKRAAKERTIGDISAKIGGLVNIENILQTAIQELGNTLPGVDVAIQFQQKN